MNMRSLARYPAAIALGAGCLLASASGASADSGRGSTIVQQVPSQHYTVQYNVSVFSAPGSSEIVGTAPAGTQVYGADLIRDITGRPYRNIFFVDPNGIPVHGWVYSTALKAL